jgi:hypothetical protein
MIMKLEQDKAIAFVILCVFLLGILVPAFVSADLPPPPDHKTFTGPLNVAGKQAFQGGILLVPADPAAETPSYKDVNEYVLTIEGAGQQTKQWNFRSNFGQSISGPIAKEESQGILDAIDIVRPPKSVTITKTMTGETGFVTVWTLSQVVYQHKHYAIYHITKTDPSQEQELVGYISVEIPIDANLTSTKTPIIDTATPTPTEVQNGQTTTGDFNGTVMPPDSWINLPDDGIPPFIDYGNIDIYDDYSGELISCTDVRPGETVSEMLLPGYYHVEAEVSVFGFPIWIDGGNADSNTPFILQVTLIVNTLVYGIIGGFIALVALIAALVGGLLYRRHKKKNQLKDGELSSEPPKLDLEDEDKKPPPESVIPDLGPVHSPPA